MAEFRKFKARDTRDGRVLVFATEKLRQHWIAQAPDTREKVLWRPEPRAHVPLMDRWTQLPPLGIRVRGELECGAEIIVFRRRMPSGSWAWATDQDRANIKQSAIVKWRYR